MTEVLGLDVAMKRGCDAVLLGASLVARPIARVSSGAEFRAILNEVAPIAVAIDSPPCWAPPGKARDCEKELTRRGINLFTTPDEARGLASAFYAWMQVGFEMFAAADGYAPLETFPHAIAVSIHGHLPLETKRVTRLAALRAVGVDTSELKNLDQIDGALCAYTAWAYTQGDTVSVGDPAEGQITLPGPTLLDRYRKPT